MLLQPLQLQFRNKLIPQLHQLPWLTQNKQPSPTAHLHSTVFHLLRKRLTASICNIMGQKPVQCPSCTPGCTTSNRSVDTASSNVALLGISCRGGVISSPLLGGAQRKCVARTISPHSAAPPAMVNTDFKAILLTNHPTTRRCLPAQQQLTGFGIRLLVCQSSATESHNWDGQKRSTWWQRTMPSLEAVV